MILSWVVLEIGNTPRASLCGIYYSSSDALVLELPFRSICLYWLGPLEYLRLCRRHLEGLAVDHRDVLSFSIQLYFDSRLPLRWGHESW